MNEILNLVMIAILIQNKNMLVILLDINIFERIRHGKSVNHNLPNVTIIHWDGLSA